MAKYKLSLAHLYGNLLNTYGDNGNVLVLKYLAKQLGIHLTTEIISLDEEFDPCKYHLVFIGGGQDYEQKIVSGDIRNKKIDIETYIENDGVLLAICGGYQLLGKYYIDAKGETIPGIAILDHYTLNQDNSRFIGDIEIYNEEFDETYYGFENHSGRTFLGVGERPLGTLVKGFGNNGESSGEGAIYRNTFCSYFHGPILARNQNLGLRLLRTAFAQKYGEAESAHLLPHNPANTN